MPSKIKILVITDLQGRILAAEMNQNKSNKKDEPYSSLIPIKNQRSVTIEVPEEILELPGPSLQRYFSNVKITFPAEVVLPKTKIEVKHRGK
ncbi:MAG TPA: hypothetical protein VMT35_17830 [Ignavibacteriaceae bacterium]|nr:hypothetical protein [Ignavibacteriaceae bacterium]